MHGMAGRLREREAVSHAATETTNTFTAAAKGFGLDRQAAHDYRNAHPELGGGRRDHPEIAADALEGEARSRGLYMYFSRVSRTRALPCTECTDPCERARIPQGFRAAVARAVYGEPGESAAPRMPKQGAPPLIFTSGAFRARARCRVRNVRIRTNVHGFCRDSARPLHERCTGSQEKAPLLGCRSKEPRPINISGAFRARARCRVRNVRIRANVHGFCRDSARPLHERCTGSQEKAPLLGCRSKEPRPINISGACRARARCRVRICTDSA